MLRIWSKPLGGSQLNEDELQDVIPGLAELRLNWITACFFLSRRLDVFIRIDQSESLVAHLLLAKIRCAAMDCRADFVESVLTLCLSTPLIDSFRVDPFFLSNRQEQIGKSICQTSSHTSVESQIDVECGWIRF